MLMKSNILYTAINYPKKLMNSLKDSGFYDQKQQEEQYLLKDSVANSCYSGDDADSELMEKESLPPEKQKWSNDTHDCCIKTETRFYAS